MTDAEARQAAAKLEFWLSEFGSSRCWRLALKAEPDLRYAVACLRTHAAVLAAAPRFEPSDADIEAVAMAMAGDLNRRHGGEGSDETTWCRLDEEARKGFCLNARAAWAAVLARVT